MKNLNIKSIAAFIILTLINIAILATGLEYRIKIISSNTDHTQLQEYKPIRQTPKYIEVGSFPDYLIAMKTQYKIEELGLTNTAIVAYFNHHQISLDDAFTLADNRNEQDIKSQTKPYMSEAEMEAALKSVQNEEFFYTVQIGIFNETNVNSFFDFPRTIDESITAQGYYRYTFGKFYTLNDAKDALKMMQENNFKKAEIIALDDLERIPLASAMEKESRRLQQSLAYFNE